MVRIRYKRAMWYLLIPQSDMALSGRRLPSMLGRDSASFGCPRRPQCALVGVFHGWTRNRMAVLLRMHRTLT